MLLFPPAIFCTGIVNSTVSATGASPLLFMVTWPSNDWAVTVQLSRFEVPSTVIELSGEKVRVCVAACAFTITGAINKRVRRSEDSRLIFFIMALFNSSVLDPHAAEGLHDYPTGSEVRSISKGNQVNPGYQPAHHDSERFGVRFRITITPVFQFSHKESFKTGSSNPVITGN